MKLFLRALVIAAAVVAGAFLFGALPHLLIAHFVWGEPFGRISYVGQVVFDTHVYLQWIGSLVEHWPVPGQFGWLDPVLRTLGSIPGISVPEAWVLSRVITLALLCVVLWTCARCFLEKRAAAAFTAIGLTFPMLALSLRPGAYAWYLPCAFLGFGIAWKIHTSLNRERWMAAIGWSITAIVLGSVYPWYALTIGILVITLWVPQIFRWFRVTIINRLWILFSVLLGAVSILIAPRLVDPSLRPIWDFYERTGIAWSRLPVITHVLVAGILIAAVALISSIALRYRDDVRDRLFVLMAAWIALFASWFHSLLTGLYTSNDHFRSGIIILSWFTAVILYSIEGGWNGLPRRFVVHIRCILLAIGVIGVVATIRCVFATSGIQSDFLQQFHIATWLSLSFVAGIVWMKTGERHVPRMWSIVWLACWIAMGLSSYAYALVMEARLTRAALPMKEGIAWIREHVPPQTVGCAAPDLADKLSAQVGRRIYPAESSSYLRETHAELAARLGIIYARRVPADEKEAEASRMTYIGYRTASCNQFPLTKKVLRLFGVSDEAFDRWSDCHATQAATEWQAFRSMPADASGNDFRTVCPIVYALDTDRGSWWVPGDYQETRVGGLVIKTRPKLMLK